MKILYYSPHPMLNLAHQAGYATHMSEMIDAFKELGHDVLPVIMGGTEATSSNIEMQQSKLKNLLKKIMPKIFWESLKDFQLLRFDKYAAKVLEQNIQEFNPDLIYERANYGQLSGVNTAQKRGIKHILEMNSPYVEERLTLQGKSLLMKKAFNTERGQLQKTDKIAVVSSALKQYFIEKHGIPENKFIVTPNAINPNSVILNQATINTLTAKYKASGETIVGFVGSFFRWHGIDMLINAFGKLSDDYPKLRLMIIGSGDLDEELKELALQTAEDKIIFTGKISRHDIFNYISLFDIAVSPNAGWYQSPIKIFEYGIMQKPIIAPDYVPLQDVMKHEEDGILIQPTVENLAFAGSRLLNDAELRTKIGNNFHEKVISNHLWTRNAESVLGI